jgi:hypothetical protein
VKVTFKNGTVVEDVTAQELPIVLAMSNPAALTRELLTLGFPPTVIDLFKKGLFRDSPRK